MAHCITAIILKGSFDKTKAEAFDLFGKDLGFDLTLFHIDHYYSACWQYKLKTTGYLETANIDCAIFPSETALAEIIRQITNNNGADYAIIQTDYFGGHGDQYANVFKGAENADKTMFMINQALKYLGVTPAHKLDAFDTLGLGDIRRQPEFLEKYIDLADEYGV